MKVNTSELIGAALDWAVAKCEGLVTGNPHDENDIGFILEKGYTPSTEWSQGGPIIERHGIELNRYAGEWMATLGGRVSISEEQGPTQLIAAMRCYVASKLGDEVEIPEELLQGESK